MSSSAGILPLYRLVTPTTTVTLAAAQTNGNTTFNTNVPTGMYMNIRIIRPVIAFKTQEPVNATQMEQVLWELTEDTTKTVVAQTDPFALDDGGLEVDDQSGAAGQASYVRTFPYQTDLFITPHPGVPTVAQQLNVVVSLLRITGASVLSVGLFLQLYFELLPITETIRGFLTNRIVLQRVT